MDEPPPYFANWGPKDGPILGRDRSPAIEVFHTADASHLPIGIAYPVGLIPGRNGPVKTFRLVIQDNELDGRFICDRRRFVRIGDAAEGLTS
jgi:hypothetical protein